MKKQYQTRVNHGATGFVLSAPVSAKAYAIKKGKELVAFMNDMRGHKVPKGFYTWEVRTIGGVVTMKYLTIILLLLSALSACGSDEDAQFMTQSDIDQLEHAHICQIALVDPENHPECNLDHEVSQ